MLVEKEIVSGKKFKELVERHINSYHFDPGHDGSNYHSSQSLRGWLEALRLEVLERFIAQRLSKEGGD